MITEKMVILKDKILGLMQTKFTIKDLYPLAQSWMLKIKKS